MRRGGGGGGEKNVKKLIRFRDHLAGFNCFNGVHARASLRLVKSSGEARHCRSTTFT